MGLSYDFRKAAGEIFSKRGIEANMKHCLNNAGSHDLSPLLKAKKCVNSYKPEAALREWLDSQFGAFLRDFSGAT